MSIKMCPFSSGAQLIIALIGVIVIFGEVVTAQLQLTINTTSEEKIILDETKYINYTVEGTIPPNYTKELYLMIDTKDSSIARPENQTILLKNENKGNWKSIGVFGIKAEFLGKTEIGLSVEDTHQTTIAEKNVRIKVVRPERVIDTVFTATVATLVSIIYINFGCALNWGEVRSTIKKPVGPAIGFFGQFIIMPLVSYGLGKLLFPDDPEMQLGLFFTGVSPGGGASNVWVAVLNGNINLSITMTTISTFAAFGMMPLWLFTLGGTIFEEANISVPYRQISTYAIALVIPLAIGYILQRFCKRVSSFLVRILKIFSSLLILFIVIFAIVANLYLFEIFSWQIVVGGMGLPWLGYSLSYILAKVFRQSSTMALTIAVETGIQNTGIAIFLLRFALPQPEADIVTVVPVYVATMTPLPLFIVFLYQKIKARIYANSERTSLIKNDIHFKPQIHGDDENVISFSNPTALIISDK
ncbi:hypothetical protein FQA39_LY01277 [Lamprigera yunnana]|nr:hypothetical protein FQA39_LY01277 [Lamprigera yunnana]